MSVYKGTADCACSACMVCVCMCMCVCRRRCIMCTPKIKYVCTRQVTPPGGVQWRRADAGNTRHATGTVDTRAHTPAGPTPPPFKTRR